MGQTVKPLAIKETGDAIFNNRLVVELCEKFHVHYRNLRILLSEKDFVPFAEGVADALKRWKALGSPEPSKEHHIELCRKQVAKDPQGQGIKINLNRNLYRVNEGRVFAEGANFVEPLYIHFKIRDLRLEMSLDEFTELHQAIVEAEKNLKTQEVVNA